MKYHVFVSWEGADHYLSEGRFGGAIAIEAGSHIEAVVKRYRLMNHPDHFPVAAVIDISPDPKLYLFHVKAEPKGRSDGIEINLFSLGSQEVPNLTTWPPRRR